MRNVRNFIDLFVYSLIIEAWFTLHPSGLKTFVCISLKDLFVFCTELELHCFILCSVFIFMPYFSIFLCLFLMSWCFMFEFTCYSKILQRQYVKISTKAPLNCCRCWQHVCVQVLWWWFFGLCFFFDTFQGLFPFNLNHICTFTDEPSDCWWVRHVSPHICACVCVCVCVSVCGCLTFWLDEEWKRLCELGSSFLCQWGSGELETPAG